MDFSKKFIKLMKSEPKQRKPKRYAWVIDESKCLGISEVNRLRVFSNKLKMEGLMKGKFAKVRNRFMI